MSEIASSLFEPAFVPQWPRRPLWDTAEWINGLAFREVSFSEYGAPVIKIGELKSGISATTRRTTQVFPERYRVEDGDTLYSWSGSPETSLDVFVWRGEAGWLNQHIFKVIEKPDVDRVFHIQLLRYLRPNLVAIATNKQTTGLGHVTQQDMRRLVVATPPLGEQRAIARILGALDDKIELNRQMNETLEALARALFQSWFVDFDPVRAKMRGEQPVGMDAATAALFPSRFVQTEHGEVPEGWTKSAVYDLASYINGAAYQAFQPNEVQQGLPIVKIAELKSGITSQTKFSTVKMPEKYRLSSGDILFSWSGNPDTSIDIFTWQNGPAWLNQHIFRVEPKRPLERSYVLATLKNLRPVFAEIARNKQTTGLGHVTVGDLQRLRVVLPTVACLETWHRVATPLFARVEANQQESSKLAATHDLLLPRLLSGELRVPDAERLVAEAV